jgi:hypothetical protein
MDDRHQGGCSVVAHKLAITPDKYTDCVGASTT